MEVKASCAPVTERAWETWVASIHDLRSLASICLQHTDLATSQLLLSRQSWLQSQFCRSYCRMHKHHDHDYSYELMNSQTQYFIICNFLIVHILLSNYMVFLLTESNNEKFISQVCKAVIICIFSN